MLGSRSRRYCLRAGAALAVFAQAVPACAQAQTYNFDIPSQDLGSALKAFARTAHQQITFDGKVVRGKRSPALRGTYTAKAALDSLLQGSHLQAAVGGSGLFIVRPLDGEAANQPQKTASLGQDKKNAQANAAGESIVVTGSRIRGSNGGASEVNVYDRKAIDQTGYATVNQFLQTVPENFNGGVNENNGQGFAAPNSSLAFSIESGANLRGIGAGSTLTLVNGHRFAASGAGDFFDISLIPVSAIDRIEVLTDGASAIYGSDAVGGVVNVILRDNFDGEDVRARYGVGDRGTPTERVASATLGRTWNSGNILVSYEYYGRSGLDAGDRSFTENAPRPFLLLPRQERQSAFISASENVTSHLKFFADGIYVWKNAFTQSDFFRIHQTDDGQYTLFGGMAGLKADLGSSWQSEVVGSYSKSTSHDNLSNNGIPYAFSPHFNSTLSSMEVTANGAVISLPGGNASLAIGGELRSEGFRDFVSAAGHVSRTVSALFAELYAPFVGTQNSMPGVRALNVTVAARHEHYSDFGSTTNPKLGLVYSPTKGINLRATYGTSFHAPTFVQLDDSGNFGYILNFPDPLSPTGLTPTLWLFGENSHLKPETATTRSIGLDLAPAISPGVSLRLTYFDINYKNRIAFPLSQFTLANGDELGPFLIRSPDPDLVEQEFEAQPNHFNFAGVPFSAVRAFIDDRLQNAASEHLNGIDFDIKKSFETKFGTWRLEESGEYLANYSRKLTSTAPAKQLVNTLYNPPHIRSRTQVTWAHGSWQTTLSLNHTGAYRDAAVIPAVRVRSWTTLDANLAYSFGRSGDTHGLGGTEISLSAINVFNQRPPFVQNPDHLNYDGSNASPLGRFLAVTVAKRW